MVAGTDSTLLRSDDGVTWQAADHIGLPNGDYGSIIFGRGEFALIGPDGIVFTSPDGVEWRARTIPTGENLKTLAFLGDRYHVAGPDLFLVSPEWQPQLYPIGRSAEDVAFGQNFELQLKTNDPDALFYAKGLPIGLELDPDTGLISGSIQDSGSSRVAWFGVVNGGNTSPLQRIEFRVYPQNGSPPVVTGRSFVAGTVGEALSYGIAFDGSDAGVQVEIEGLPEGLTHSSEFEVSGIPVEAGPFPVTVRLTNLYGTDEAVLQFYVSDAGPGGPEWEAVGPLSAIVSGQVALVPGVNGSPERYFAFGLPDGVQLDSATGRLSGVLLEASVHEFLLVAENAFGRAAMPVELSVTYLEPRASGEVSTVVHRTGDTVSLTAQLWGSDLRFQWLRDGRPLEESEENGVSGAGSAELVLAGAVTPDSGRYRLRAWNEDGEAVSGNVELTVTETYPVWAQRMVPGGANDPNADGLGVGVPNLLAYALGLTPEDRDRLPKILAGVGGSPILEVQLSRTVEEISVVVEHAADPSEWGPYSKDAYHSDADPRSRTLYFDVGDAGDTGFFRVLVGW